MQEKTHFLFILHTHFYKTPTSIYLIYTLFYINNFFLFYFPLTHKVSASLFPLTLKLSASHFPLTLKLSASLSSLKVSTSLFFFFFDSSKATRKREDDDDDEEDEDD